MIAFISGKLVTKYPTHVIVDNNGIGLEVLIPVSTFEQLGDTESTVTLLTHLHVREDALTLYGFATEDERELFRDLIAVNGVGPKLALSILSGNSVEFIYKDIAESNETNLIKIKGLGKKTAQRLILDLQDKAQKKVEKTIPQREPIAVVSNEVSEQTVLAMISLGYSKSEAENAVAKAVAKKGADASVEELVRTALGGQ